MIGAIFHLLKKRTAVLFFYLVVQSCFSFSQYPPENFINAFDAPLGTSPSDKAPILGLMTLGAPVEIIEKTDPSNFGNGEEINWYHIRLYQPPSFKTDTSTITGWVLGKYLCRDSAFVPDEYTESAWKMKPVPAALKKVSEWRWTDVQPNAFDDRYDEGMHMVNSRFFIDHGKDRYYLYEITGASARSEKEVLVEMKTLCGCYYETNELPWQQGCDFPFPAETFSVPVKIFGAWDSLEVVNFPYHTLRSDLPPGDNRLYNAAIPAVFKVTVDSCEIFTPDYWAPSQWSAETVIRERGIQKKNDLLFTNESPWGFISKTATGQEMYFLNPFMKQQASSASWINGKNI